MGRPWGIVRVNSLEDAQAYVDVVARSGCVEVLIPLRESTKGALLTRGADGAVTVTTREDIQDVIAEIRELRHDDMTWDDVDRNFDSVMVFLPQRDFDARLGNADDTRVGGADLLMFHDDGEFGDQFYEAGSLALRRKLIVRIWP